MDEVMRQSQSYSSTLQSYNTSLQADIKEEKQKREEASCQRDLLQGQAAEISGRVKNLEQLLQFETVSKSQHNQLHIGDV
jgi:kinesin family protein C1